MLVFCGFGGGGGGAGLEITGGLGLLEPGRKKGFCPNTMTHCDNVMNKNALQFRYFIKKSLKVLKVRYWRFLIAQGWFCLIRNT